jgi:hypothetical protein
MVLLGHCAHPVGRVASDGCHLFGGQVLDQQRAHLPVTVPDRIIRREIASFQGVKRKMGLKGESFLHVLFMHQELVWHGTWAIIGLLASEGCQTTGVTGMLLRWQSKAGNGP